MAQLGGGASEGSESSSDEVRVRCALSDDFAAWLSQAGGSLAVTTYQAGKLAMVGWDGRQVTLVMRHFPKPMGLAVRGSQLALACRHEVWFFADAPLLAGDYHRPGRYDALYLPRAAYYTGDLDIHDLGFGTDGLWLVNTRFSCLASLSDQFHFVPRWQPSFVSQLAPQDRCHLNGLGMRGGRPEYVTAMGESDEPDGWRENKASGGILIGVQTGEIVLRGLCMPHSPRWHNDRWWLLNSGTGELWQVDPERGGHEVVCALPGYLRGLCFIGRYALVGLSQIRERHIFGSLPIQQRCTKLECGVAVVDLETGKPVGMLQFTEGCQELYDVQFLPDVFRPTILNLQKEAAGQAITAPGLAYWLHPKGDEAEDAPGRMAKRRGEDVTVELFG